ncbi:DivIVA domain-containing protein [Alloscardovia criceti]|uniref:DivIVA domain-containing protein n=1 Tax=Alloscardovia criceti TaxID=356828 RepID=UPI00035EB039|nr:DivIVA domain-containing protein [Alloscardovia criceti]
MADSRSQEQGIARARKNEWGYSVSQVDEFLQSTRHLYEESEPNMTQTEIQNQVFDLEKNGYDVAAVDAAMKRLQDAVVDKLAEWTISHEGDEAWFAETQQLALTIIPRAQREKAKIFSRARAFKPAYDIKEVDAVVWSLALFINDELSLGVNLDELPENPAKKSPAQDTYHSQDIEEIGFTQRSGHKGYDEAEVDAFINRAVEVLTRMESTKRLEERGELQAAQHEGTQSGVDNLLSYDNYFVAPLIPDVEPTVFDKNSTSSQTSAHSNATGIFEDAKLTPDADSSTSQDTESGGTSVLARLAHTTELSKTSGAQERTTTPAPTTVQPVTPQTPAYTETSSHFDEISQTEQQIFHNSHAQSASANTENDRSVTPDAAQHAQTSPDTASAPVTFAPTFAPSPRAVSHRAAESAASSFAEVSHTDSHTSSTSNASGEKNTNTQAEADAAENSAAQTSDANLDQDSFVDFSTVLDTGSIQSVQFHMPQLGDDKNE